MISLNIYHQVFLDKSYSNVKIVQISIVNWILAKLWIILANKFSELLLPLIVLYKQDVQQIAKEEIYLTRKAFCSGSSDFLFANIMSESNSGQNTIRVGRL